MQVYVLSEQKLYMLTANNFTTMDNWKEIASGDNIFIYKGSVSTYADLPKTGLTSGDIYYVAADLTSYYYNGTTWIPLGSPDKSSYLWHIPTNLNTLAASITVAANTLTRADDSTITATLDDIIVGKTIVTDPRGVAGVVTGISGSASVVISTITKDTQSDGIHHTSTTLNKTIGGTTSITGMTIANLVLNETMVYDNDGTLAVITAESSGTLTATTITKVLEHLGDTFITSNELSTTIGATTVIPLITISGINADAIVANNTLIADTYGTLGVATTHDVTDVTVKTLSLSIRSDGVYKTSHTLNKTISGSTTVALSEITGIAIRDIVLNETLLFDNAGTVAKIASLDTINNEVAAETITMAGDPDATKLKAVLNSSQNVGGVKSGDSFAAGTDFESLFRAILDPVLNPTFTNPSAALSVTGTTLLESGASASRTFSCSFNRGSISPAYGTSGYRAGAATSYTLNGGTAQSGHTWTETITSATTNYYATVNYAAGEQPKNSIGQDYDSPLAAGSVNTNTIKFEFVDALWANTVSIVNVAKLNLVSKSAKSYEFNFPAQTVTNPEIFDVPASWTVSKVEVYNELSGKYQDVASEFTTSSVTHNNAAGTGVSYVRYTDNRGYSAGTRKIKITWS